MATTASRLQNAQGAEFHFYFRIEGIGWWNSTSSQSESLYCFTRLPDWSPSATQKFITGLAIPKGFSQSIDPIGGVESPTNLDLEFDEYFDGATYQTTPVWAGLFGSSRAIVDATTNYPITRLTATLTQTGVIATVESTAAFPSSGQLFIGNECITYTAKGGGGLTFTGLNQLDGGASRATRGLHPAVTGEYTKYRHRYAAEDTNITAAHPIVATVPFSWYNRRIALYMIHRDQDGTWGTEAEALRLYTGRIQSQAWTGKNWKFSTRSIIADLDRPIFNRPNEPKTTVGVYISSQMTGWRSTFITHMRDVTGAEMTTDNYSFSLSTLYFNNFFNLAEDLRAASIAAAPGDKEPRVNIRHGTTGTSTQHVTFQVIGATTVLGLNACRVGLFVPPAIRRLFVTDDGSALPEVLSFAGGSDITDVDAVMYAASHSALLISHDQTESIRVQDGSGLISNQGDWPTARAYISIQLDDDVSMVASVTNVTTANPSVITCVPQIAYAAGVASVAESYARLGPSEIRQVFIPYHGDGLGKALLRMMVSTGGGGHGTYDVLPDGYGAGIDDNDIDIASFERLDSLYPGLTGRTYYFTKAEPLRAILEQEAKLLGFIIVMRSGKITLRSVPLGARRDGGSSLLTLDESNQEKDSDRPTFLVAPDSTYSSFTISSGWNAFADKFMNAPMTLVDIQSQDIFGRGRDLKIESRGLTRGFSRSIWLGPLAGRLLAFRFPYPRIDRTLSRDLMSRLTVGDVVTFTERSMPNAYTGGYGVTTLYGFIERLSWDYDRRAGRCSIRLFPTNRVSPLAPSVSVASYAAGVLTLDATTFGGDGAGGNDALLFDLNDPILICERNPANVASADSWSRTVAGRTSTTITLNTALSSPAYDAAKEYFVTFNLYSLCVAGANATAQLQEASFMADQTDGVIETSQDFYLYWSAP